MPCLALLCFIFVNLTGCFNSNLDYNSVIASEDDVIVIQKSENRGVGKNAVSTTGDVIVLNIDCKDSVYDEMSLEIDELKKENESLNSLAVSNIIQDQSAQRTSFDLQLTNEQIKILASDSEEDTNSCSSTNKSWYSKKTYCATGGSGFRTIACPNGSLDYEQKQFKPEHMQQQWLLRSGILVQVCLCTEGLVIHIVIKKQ